ncbi:alpha/beta hydrolase, partial [Candidatus Uhrbacteria bacterium]|nr:alpha/beta hydrolase [Candidatus Uhrbacteria bacterium]
GAKILPQHPVIFVPGIKGSVLERNGNTVWLTVSELLGAGEPLTWSPDDGVTTLRAFDRLTIIPWLAEYRPYYQIIAQLACTKDGYVFPYDWRAPPARNAEQFLGLVNAVIQETGQRPSVVAHSMGGLIAHTVVKEHPEKFNRVVYVTVPFDPGIGYLDDLTNGSLTGVNATLLSSDTLFTHPASFLLLPHNGTHRYRGNDLMDAAVWKKFRLSAFSRASVDEPAFQKLLDDTVAYHQRLDRPTEIALPTLLVVGTGHATVFEINQQGNRVMKDGDGRVCRQCSAPQDHFLALEKQSTTLHHGQQLNDPKLVSDIMHFLTK